MVTDPPSTVKGLRVVTDPPCTVKGLCVVTDPPCTVKGLCGDRPSLYCKGPVCSDRPSVYCKGAVCSDRPSLYCKGAVCGDTMAPQEVIKQHVPGESRTGTRQSPKCKLKTPHINNPFTFGTLPVALRPSKETGLWEGQPQPRWPV